MCHTIRPRRGAAPPVSRPPRRVERSGIGCSTAPHLVDGTNGIASSGWVSARAGVSARVAARARVGARARVAPIPTTVPVARLAYASSSLPVHRGLRYGRAASARRRPCEVLAGLLAGSWPVHDSVRRLATRLRTTAPLGPGSVVQSTRLTVSLEGARIGRDQRPVAFAANEEADDVVAAVVVLDEGPDDDRVAAFRGLHLGPV
jgi:hypothetical protein